MAKLQPLTASMCHKVDAPLAGNKLYRCGKVRGLALRVTAKGHRAFVFNYVSPSSHERRLTIGPLGPWSLPAARERASELRRMVDTGIDPLEKRNSRRQSMNVRDLWEWYSANAMRKLAPASQRDITYAWLKKVEPFVGRHTKVEDLSRQNVQALVDYLTESAGPVAANRCHSYLRRILNLAKNEGFIEANPAALGIDRNPEHSRERYLTKSELHELVAAMDERGFHLPTLAIKLLMLTGARRAEVMSMEWQHLDLEQRLWLKPAAVTKQSKRHRVPLSSPAIAVLRTIESKKLDERFVFPGPGKHGHLTDLKAAWTTLKHSASLGECRLHDLRHTFASLLVSDGSSLELIGAMLGHSQVQTTRRYAHLHDEALHKAAQQVGDAVYRGAVE